MRHSGRTVICAALLGLLVAGPALVQAQPAPATNAAIYTCTLPDGRRMTSDRPIAECSSVETRVLNRDGSLRRVVPPTPTANELARQEAEQRRLAQQRQAQLDAVRRDRNLVARYPDEGSHQRARDAALEPVVTAMRSTDQRIADLQRDRQPLMAETDFYQGRPLPDKLRQQLNANEAAIEAQRGALLVHRAEFDRINRLYDAELERLRRLWAGEAPGSVVATSSATVPVAAETRGGAAQAPR